MPPTCRRCAPRVAPALPSLLLLLLACFFLTGAAAPARADVPETILHSFAGGDGQNPSTGLSLAPNGFYYGATMSGGSVGAGCVYKISGDGTTYSVVHSFQDGTVSGDGVFPVGNLLIGSNGTVYGETTYGGAYGDGVIYSISPAGVTTILDSLPSYNSSGSYQLGGLAMGSDGLLYGMTPADRGAPCVLFSLATNGSGFATRYVFDGGTAATGPQNPVGSLAPAPNGVFYGVSLSGGSGTNGTIFKLTPVAGSTTFAATILHSFGDGSVTGDAQGQQNGVTLDSAGDLYGAVDGGGLYGEGCVYELSASGTYSVTPLYASGQDLIAQPIVGSDGTVYGVTSGGGTYNAGAVYSISPINGYSTLYNFQGSSTSTGDAPVTQLALDASGNLLGTAAGGAQSDGVVYKLTMPQPPSLTLNPSTVAPLPYPYGLSTVTGTLSLGTSAASNVYAQLQASSGANGQNGAYVNLGQATVEVPQGSTSATFPFTVSTTNNFTVAQTVAITASYTDASGSHTLSANLTINPPPVTLGYLNAPASIPENTTATSNTVGLVSSAASAVTVALSSSDPTAAAVPASVVIPAGSNSATFPITTGTISAPEDVTVTATANGTTVSQVVTVTVPGPALSSIALYSNYLVQGTTSSANSVTLTGPATIGSTVTLTSSAPNIVSVPASVFVPVGLVTEPFTVSVGTVTSEQTVTITGKFNGGVYSTTVTVEPPGLQPIKISSSLMYGSTTTTTNTVSISPALSTSTTVTLTSSNPAVASVPASVIIPAGTTSQTFSINTQPLSSNQLVTITAAALGTTRSQQIVVEPIQLSAFQLAQASITTPGTLAGNTVSIPAAVNTDTTVALSCYPQYGAVSVPATVVIPAGSLTATFSISATPSDSWTNVSISASLNGSTISQNLNVYPPPYAILYYVTLNPGTATGGTTTTGNQAVLDTTATTATTVTLKSSNPSVATVPATIVVPAGATSQSFSIVTQPVTTSQTVFITAASGGVSSSAVLTINPLTLSGLTLAQSSVTGIATITGNTVTIPTAIGGSTTVTLASSNTAAATVPASVVIPAGATSATFSITTASVAAAQTATITASLNGSSRTATLTVNPPPPATLSAITLSPSTTLGGTTTTANTVTLSSAATSNTTIALSSSSPAIASVPASVTIPAGATSQTFSIVTASVSADQSATISATSNGTTVTAPLAVVSTTSHLKSVLLNPTTIPSNNYTVNNRVYWSGNAPANETITLTSSNTAVAIPMSSVVIAAGSSSHTFEITVYSVTSPQTVTILATCDGITQSATLTVTPPYTGPALSAVTLSPSTVFGGVSTTANTVSFAGNVTAGSTVTLTSSNPAIASVPASVTVAAGSSSQTFAIKTTNVSSAQSVVITATFGAMSQSAFLTINSSTAVLYMMNLSPPSTYAGTTTTGNTVAIANPVPTDTTILLATDNNALGTVPVSVVVPAGSTTAVFAITTNYSSTSQVLNITASYNGSNQTAGLTVLAANPPLSSVSVAPSSVVGGSSLTNASVSLSGSSTANTTVALSSSNPAVAGVPASVVVAAGATSQSFTITTSTVTAATTVTITATLNGVSKTATITILPVSLKSVVLSPTSVKGGSVPTTANRVYWSGNAPASETVTLTSSNPAVAAVPSTVTIQQGSSSHVFTITTKAVTSAQSVTITATSGGVSQSATLTVTP